MQGSFWTFLQSFCVNRSTKFQINRMYNSVVSGVRHFCPSSAKSKGIRTLAKIGLNANTSDYSINLREIHVEDILNSHDCLLKRNIRLRTSS